MKKNYRAEDTLAILVGVSILAISVLAYIIADKDIDPAALFYTESPLALSAEKTVRKGITGD